MATGTRRDYYEVLGVSRDASLPDIKRAYRKLAVQFHPDRNPTTRRPRSAFKEASEAYAVLSDADKRVRYEPLGHREWRPTASPDSTRHRFGDFAMSSATCLGSLRRHLRQPAPPWRAAPGP